MAGKIGGKSMSGHSIQITDIDLAAPGGEAMVEAAKSLELVADLHQRQAEMYAGGPLGPVADLLDDDVVWHLAGDSPIAGEHRGWEAVLRFFAVGRGLAQGTMRVRPEEVVAASRDVVIQFVGGTMSLAGEVVSWKAVGFYRIERGRIRAAWLVPLDLELFDQAWTGLDHQSPGLRRAARA
jgi:ketosteroid isomerase-like protein